MNNVRWEGELDYETAISRARDCSIGLIAPAINPYTLSSTPMKILDYVLAGILPVSREMPFLELYRDLTVLTGTNADQIACQIRRYIQNQEMLLTLTENNRKALAGYSYEQRIREISNLLGDSAVGGKSLNAAESSNTTTIRAYPGTSFLLTPESMHEESELKDE